MRKHFMDCGSSGRGFQLTHPIDSALAGRPVYEPDSHGGVVQCQSVRLLDRAAEACRGDGGESLTVDAFELPRDTR